MTSQKKKRLLERIVSNILSLFWRRVNELIFFFAIFCLFSIFLKILINFFDLSYIIFRFIKDIYKIPILIAIALEYFFKFQKKKSFIPFFNVNKYSKLFVWNKFITIMFKIK